MHRECWVEQSILIAAPADVRVKAAVNPRRSQLPPEDREDPEEYGNEDSSGEYDEQESSESNRAPYSNSPPISSASHVSNEPVATPLSPRSQRLLPPAPLPPTENTTKGKLFRKINSLRQKKSSPKKRFRKMVIQL